MPRIMGIVNTTPDSFSDGGTSFAFIDAVAKAERLLADGADILDIGGESTRPGAAEVPVIQEIERTAPVIAAIRKKHPDCLISIDTRKSEVAAAALAAGADIINDVSGLSFDPRLAAVAGRSGATLVIGHTRGTPEIMRRAENCCYTDIIAEVTAFWRGAAAMAEACGVKKENIIFDPCLGFAKNAAQDCEILRRIPEMTACGPLLIGHSRKSFIGEITGEKFPMEREGGTVAVSMFATRQGVSYLRLHNVKATVQALRMWRELIENGE